MEYEETYHGRRITIATFLQTAGGWEAKADLLDSGDRITLWRGSGYHTEKEARDAALSGAAGAIDRSRMSKGKP
jgi:hypothetical protein